MDWKKTIAAAAPALATALGGPLAGTAMTILSRTLLGEDTARPDQVEEAVMAGLSVTDLAKLREADREFRVQMRQLDIRIDEIEAADRANARAHAVAGGPVVIWATYILAGVVLLGFGASVAWVLNADALPEDAARLTLIGSVIGYGAALAQQVCAYLYGSSAGSKAKTDAMADAIKGLGRSDGATVGPK